MTRLVWVHDHVFVRGPAGEFWSEGKLPSSVWSRYLGAFDAVEVCARVRDLRPNETFERLTLTTAPGVTFRALPSLSSARALLSPPRAATAALTEAIAGATAVIARLPSEAGLLALEVARRVGRPAAVEVVGCAWDAYWNFGTLAAMAYAPIAFTRMRRAVARAPFALYVSTRFLQGRYPCPGVTTACSNVELTLPPPEVLSQRLERKGGAISRLGTIGSLGTDSKGFDTAIRALAVMPRDRGTPSLHILGGGDPARLRHLAAGLGVEDRVHFDGALPSGAPVNAWLDAVDLYLQPSRQEGVPRALIEAMARGCPAIGSTAGGIPELLDPSALHSPGDAKRLGGLIRRAMTDPAWVETQMVRNARTAEDFRREVLDPRRTAFWQRFAEFAKATGRQA